MAETRRKSVLYVTPVMPQRFGNGLAMRAASVLEALARRFDVHLFVVPVAGDPGPPSDFVHRHTVRVGGLDLAKNLDPLFALISRILDRRERERAERAYAKPFLSRFCTTEGAHYLSEWASQAPVAGVHLMRLYLAPLAWPFLRRPELERPFCVLDLDDDDVVTCERLASLHSHLGDHNAAAAAAAEAEKYRSFAASYVNRFDCVTVSSESDARRLGCRFPAVRFAVVPNSYPSDGPVRSHRPSAPGPLRMIFVGSFGYWPNVDAARFLCGEVLPAMRRMTDREIRIDLIGAGESPLPRVLAQDPSIVYRGFVKDLAPFYAAADVAIVPVRAGGGTRIKILEAFAHGVPVVTTRTGADGLDVRDGEQVLCADTPEELARAALRLKESPELSAELSAHAAALFAARYSPARADAAIGDVWARYADV